MELLGFKLKQIPSELLSFDRLKTLSLGGNQICRIDNLPESLQKLYLGDNQISRIENLPEGLQELSLGGNRISRIENLPEGLQSLDLRKNQIRRIENLPVRLQSLCLWKNQVSRIENLPKSLQSLDLGKNPIRKIENLPNGLKELNLDGSSRNFFMQIIEIFPSRNFYLENLPEDLEILSIEDYTIRRIENLPSELKNLRLTRVRIDSIENLPQNLLELDFTKNQIELVENLPNSIQKLYLSFNRIERVNNLPQSLKVLDLSYNRLGSIEHLPSLPDTLEDLKLYGNPIQHFPAELLGSISGESNCLQAWKAWQADLEQGKVINRTVRLFVTGNGNVGKSSLIEALKNGKCNKEFASTHAIQIETLDLLGSEKPVTVQIFDFGGQEIYMGTHSLFLRGRAVQMVVFDDLTEAQPTVYDRVTAEVVRNQPLLYWLNSVEKQSSGSEYVVVRNKVEATTKVNKAVLSLVTKLRKRGINVAEVSAVQGFGMKDLNRFLWQAAHNLPEYGMEMPASWDAVRQHFLQNLKQPTATRKKLFNRIQFSSLCRLEKVVVGSDESLLRYLHDTGVIYCNDDYLPDILILDQEWAIAAIYAALNRSGSLYKKLREEGTGRCLADDLFSAFGTDYTSDQCWLLLHFMESCGLCFPVKDENYEPRNINTTYILPEFLEAEIPVAVEEFRLKSGLRVFHKTYDFLPYAHIQQVISRWGLKTYFYNIGRSGLFVDTAKGQFALTAVGNRLTLFVEAHMSAEVIEDLQKQFAYTSFKKWQESSRFSRWTKQFWNILIGKSNTKEWIKSVDSSSNSENPDMYNSTVEVIQPKTRKIIFSYSHIDEHYRNELDKHLIMLKRQDLIKVWHDRKIVAGEVWDEEIKAKFQQADMVLLMISSDFLNSEYIWEQELKIVRERLGTKDGVRVIPIFTRPCDTTGLDFMKLQGGQRDNQSQLPWLSTSTNRDQVYVDIVGEIRKALVFMR